MDVGCEAKYSISKVPENPQGGTPHSTFLEWRAFCTIGKGTVNNFSHLMNKLPHCRRSRGGRHSFFTKMVWNADSLAPQLTCTVWTGQPGFSPPSTLEAIATEAALPALHGGQGKWPRGNVSCRFSKEERDIAFPSYRSRMAVIQAKAKWAPLKMSINLAYTPHKVRAFSSRRKELFGAFPFTF